MNRNRALSFSRRKKIAIEKLNGQQVLFTERELFHCDFFWVHDVSRCNRYFSPDESGGILLCRFVYFYFYSIEKRD